MGATSGSSVLITSSSWTNLRGESDLKGSPDSLYTLLHSLHSSPTTTEVSTRPRSTLGELFHFSSVTTSPILL